MKVIAARLGVSASTVSRWVRDIPLTPAQREALAARNHRFSAQHNGRAARRESARRTRERWQSEGRWLARMDDGLLRAGCMLYWAEGSKRRGQAIFTNSDVAMMRLFLRFLREWFDPPVDRLTFSVNCFLGNGLSLAEIERYWLDELELPDSCLRKGSVNRPSPASKRTGRVLLHGTGRLTCHSTEIVQTIYGAIQEYGGFTRPAWLD